MAPPRELGLDSSWRIEAKQITPDTVAKWLKIRRLRAEPRERHQRYRFRRVDVERFLTDWQREFDRIPGRRYDDTIKRPPPRT